MNALFSCFTEAIATIRKKIPWIIVFSVAIVIGIILGVVISKPLSKAVDELYKGEIKILPEQEEESEED